MKPLSQVTFLCALVGPALSAAADEPAQASMPAESAASAPAASPALASGEITTEATGVIELSISRDSPIFAEFDGSKVLTERMRAALKERGFELAETAAAGKASLVFRGDLTLIGGPKFHKGVKVRIGEVTEKSLAAANHVTGPAQVVQPVASVAINAAGYTHSLSNFSSGLFLSNIANTLGDATGVRGWFNTKVAGDPRGICLSHCEDWNKVKQTAYLRADLSQPGAASKEVRVLSKAFSETLAPEQVISEAVGRAIAQIQVDGPSVPVANSGG